MNRDNHDKQMLKAIQRIARSLESLVQIETLVHEDLLNEVGGEYMQGRIDKVAEMTEYVYKGYGKIIARYDLSEYANQIRVETIDEFLEHLLNDISFVSLEDEIKCRKIFIGIAEKLKEQNNG